MQVKIIITAKRPSSVIPVNYQYPLSAVIYKILAQGDADYATFLHDRGYTRDNSLKAFKLFTCSDLNTPFRIKGDRLCLLSNEAILILSFHLPQAASTFIKGLFMNQQIEIADFKSKATFSITSVEILPPLFAENDTHSHELTLEPISPIVCGQKSTNGHYNFLSPDHEAFCGLIMFNWKEKHRTLYGEEASKAVFEDAKIAVELMSNPPKSRLTTIKAGTPGETKIRGYMNFLLKAKANADALELLINSGVGLYNSLCMGSVKIRP
ncbi:CRISPR-associated endoribonuclease Cas6 [Chitinophaga flava]|uniref:CRISPR-associated endoribonuclease Cas6 n=1 Tax=Chitinophaga flava TaxID=2259036 RepID=A0A365Y1T6_9BACT|nr:CRISPR-associated endoribonuclease Cas6 [Chitinophaga flava]RBL91805.1 CRISPR-associated endoribonuclease Cas6 [Chitinophaga flava]